MPAIKHNHKLHIKYERVEESLPRLCCYAWISFYQSFPRLSFVPVSLLISPDCEQHYYFSFCFNEMWPANKPTNKTEGGSGTLPGYERAASA